MREEMGWTRVSAAGDLGRSYVAWFLNSPLLAPDIIEAAVAGDEPDGLSIATLRRGVPVRWDVQSAELS